MRKPTKPVPASTVILVRDDCETLQVYLARRSAQARFMPGNYVFPGGKVDPGDWDAEYWIARADLDYQGIFKHYGTSMPLDAIIAHGVSAIREVYEEVGILFSHFPEKDANVLRDLAAARLAGSPGKGWLREVLEERKWRLALSGLFAWSHWITPEAMPLRFDTRFFVAVAPSGQECRPDNDEITRGIWVNSMEALKGNDAGEIPLSPPTLVTLQGLLRYSSVTDVLREAKRKFWGAAKMPKLLSSNNGPLIVLPWDPSHDHIGSGETGQEELKWLEPGEKFSRLLYHEGLWRPVEINDRARTAAEKKGEWT